MLAALACACAYALRPFDLRCEMLHQPLGIDTTRPALGWKLDTPHRGSRQTAYQILAASDPALLSEGKADLWDSGRVASDSSQWVPYGGRALRSRDVVYWQVRVWDENGKPSSWAGGARFCVGILDRQLWAGRYIGMERDNRAVQPMLHKAFRCSRTGEPAFLHISTLGYHEVYINGNRVGDDVLCPAVTEFPKRYRSMCYDVSRFLNEGRNDIVLWLGSGWYDGKAPGIVPGGPYAMAQIDVPASGGWETLVQTDSTWHARPSGYYNEANFGESRFGGEAVRAAELLPHLGAQALDSAQWRPVTVMPAPRQEISPMMCEPNKVMAEIQPREIRRFADDVWLVDMGRTVVGWTRIDMGRLSPGQEVSVSYCDMLGLNGDFESGVFTDRYTASGRGNETFCNKFNYHAYRYLKIRGLGHRPAIGDIAGMLVSTGYTGESAFVCSDPDLNAIHDMVHYTLRCLTQSGYMVDCPHLERMGYGGDGNASLLAAQTQYDMYPLYRNWMQAYADAQGDDGRVPHAAPAPWACGGGPYWCAFVANAPWHTYLQYGDLRVLRQYYPNMKRYLSYVRKYMTDGLLKLDGRWPSSRLGHWFLGDWALPNEEHQMDSVSIDLVNSCSVSMVLDIMKRTAGILGEKVDSADCARLQWDVNKWIFLKYYNERTGTYAGGLQLDMAFPQLVGATPEMDMERVNKALRRETYKRFDGHLFAGLVGVPVVTQWLTRSGDSQLMYDMLKQRGFPGYLYMIENGATTTWEHWHARRSRVHNCYNGIGSWFYEALMGLTPDPLRPGGRHFTLQPQMADGVSFVRALRPTPYGPVTVDWKLDSNRFDITVEVPTGVEVTLRCPEGLRARYAQMPPAAISRKGIIFNENERGVDPAPRLDRLPAGEDIELQSGKYRVTYYLKDRK